LQPRSRHKYLLHTGLCANSRSDHRELRSKGQLLWSPALPLVPDRIAGARSADPQTSRPCDKTHTRPLSPRPVSETQSAVVFSRIRPLFRPSGGGWEGMKGSIDPMGRMKVGAGDSSRRPAHRLDEPLPGYPLAGCSPADPASVSPGNGQRKVSRGTNQGSYDPPGHRIDRPLDAFPTPARRAERSQRCRSETRRVRLAKAYT